MKIILILVFGQLTTNLWARVPGCFEEHTSTAKKLNLERADLYSHISNGESKKVTRKFVAIQNLLLPITYLYDQKAKKIRSNENSGFFCQEFISMNETPDYVPYKAATTPIPEELSNKTYSSRELQNRLKHAFENDNFSKLLEQTQIELHRLEQFPSYYCMTRHFLESIARAANFAQTYNEKEQKISKKYIKLQILGFMAAGILDIDGASLQEKGIAILCQDIPMIPLN